MKPSELRKIILESGEELVQQYVDAALGKGVFTSTNLMAREEIWSMLKSMMLKASDSMDKIDIDEAREILQHVTDGTITMSEGDKLLSMYKQVADIERPGSDGNSAPNITVVIQPAGSDVDIQPKLINQETLEHENDGD